MKSVLSILLAGGLCSPYVMGAQDAAAVQPVTWGIIAGGDGVAGGYRGELDEGVVGGLVTQFPLVARHLSLRADLLYHWISDGKSDFVHRVEVNGANESRQECNGGIQCAYFGTWSRIVSGSFGLVYRLNDPTVQWAPYMIGGIAGYLTGASDEPLVRLRPNHVGFQGGIGFEVRPSTHTYFAEMRYLGMPPGGVVPIVIGMRF